MRALLSTGMGEGELGAVVGCLSTIIVMGALLALCGKKSTIPSPQPDPSANSAEMPIHASAEYPDQKEGHDQVIVNAPHQPTPEWAVPSAGPSQEHHPGSQPAPAPPQQTAPAPRQPPQPNPPARVRPWLCLVEKRIASADQLAPELYESSVVQISPSSQGYPPVDAYENTDLSGTQVSAPIGTQAESTVEDTIRTLHTVCDVMGGAIQPQCYLHQGTIRAGMHAAVAEVTNRFRTEVTAFFFPDPSRMEKHMKMYQKQGIRDFMPVISEQRSPLIYKCQTLREAMSICRTQRDVLHELFTVCQHITRQLVLMHRRKIVVRDICVRNVVRASLGQVRSWTFLEYAGAVKCGAKTESMPVRSTPPELASGRLSGSPMIVRQSYDMWQLGVFIYELSTGRPYWPSRMTDGQILHNLATPQARLPHESNPVSIDLVNRILGQLLTRDEGARLDAVALKALLDHEEETGTLSSTMNAMPPRASPVVILDA